MKVAQCLYYFHHKHFKSTKYIISLQLRFDNTQNISYTFLMYLVT